MSTLNIIKGQTVDYQFSAYNRGPLASPSMTFDLFDSHDVVLSGKHADVSLFPWQRSLNTVKVVFEYRGIYILGIKYVRVTDLFSMVRLKIKRKESIKVTVFPRVIEISKFSFSQFSEIQGVRNYRKSSDETLKDTRKYMYGDSMSRIHWNLTAQKSDLITKLYESENDLDVLFLLDLSPVNVDNPLRYEDYIIEFCVAVVRFLLISSQSVRLVFAQGSNISVIDGGSAKEFDSFYHALSAAEFNSIQDIEDIYAESGNPGYTIVLSAREPDQRLLDKLSVSGWMDYYRLVLDGGGRTQYDNSASVKLYDLLPDDDIRVLLEEAP